MPDALDRARTPLLTLITQESLEKDYQVVAARRDARDPEGGGRRSGPVARSAVIAAVAAFGVLVTVAALQTSRNADVEVASRESLIGRIEQRREGLRGDQAQIADLREQNADAEDDYIQLGDVLNATQDDLTDLRVVTGFVAVRGEGVRVVLENAPYADETTQIRDSDLALLADGLWHAGAEAISINGHRLTARSAIRNSGPAIEVNGVGIASPYTVTAIGDMDTLAAGFLESASGLAFASLAGQYGFTYDFDNEADLRIPAAPTHLRRLRSAVEDNGQLRGGEGDGTS